ncbi:hypothetical protein N7474_005321 [Penicillium riverlandense]|uniref:uncharacterized protein n=1 Tax=Penicillium riverlandense TaxID=1903569 RepID=UPI002547E777|nr:uncharacterized protein N7474_005321 [Penicillium riverlandense]KAJ5819730.1 hypothetical protein N7474_005321 [Penicillium riverlandense]
MPVSHLTLTVSHLPASTSFFLSCLQPLGYQFVGRHEAYIGFGQKQGKPADFWITEQKPGSPASAIHVAFPAPSRDAVSAFFICALKAGGQIHGEPKVRDAQSGYYSAAVIDFDGNSIEAVYRPGGDNRSIVSKTSSNSETSAVRAASKPPTTAIHASSHIVRNTTSDDGSKVAKTIVGTLIGAAAGAAIAYAMVRGDSQSSKEANNPPPPQQDREYAAVMPPPSSASSEEQPCPYDMQPIFRALEAPPSRSIYSSPRTHSSHIHSTSSKNPRASTIYDTKEHFHHTDDRRRASEGSIFSIPEDVPLRAIEYPPSQTSPQRRTSYPCNTSTIIKSYATDKPRREDDGQSSRSASTIKASSRHGRSHTSSRAGSSTSARTARNIPLPESSCSVCSSAPKSYVSARAVPLPESVLELDLDSIVTPDDSISQVGSSGRRPSNAHSRSHSRSRHSTHSTTSHASKRSSKGTSRQEGGSKAASRTSSRRAL